MLALLLVLFLFALFGLRLARGPIEIPRLASWFATHLTGEGVDVRIAKADLVWAGYYKGGEVPFVLQLAGIEVRTQSGAVLADVPTAVLSFPVVDLFGGKKPVTLTGKEATFPYSNVPVSWYAKLWPGDGFTLSHSDVHVKIGAGHIGEGRDAVALDDANFVLSVLQDGSVSVAGGQARLAAHGHSSPNLTFSFSGRYDHRWQGSLNVGVDQIQAVDLSAFWPVDLLPVTREWITTHIIAGRARDASFVFGLGAAADLSNFRIDRLQGSFSIDDMSLVWLQGAPLLTHMDAVFAMQNMDTGLITATSGNIDGIKVKNGSMQITGLSGLSQAGVLKMNLEGSVQAVLAVLGQPPLNLLGHVLDSVKKATGTAKAELTVDIPFKKNLKESEISLQVKAILSNLCVPTPFPGVFFTKGQMLLKSDGHMLDATARANLAGYPVNLTIKQDLSASGGHGRFAMNGTAGSTLWQALEGQVPYLTARGTAPFDFTTSDASEGQQQAELKMDLSPTALSIAALGWTKPLGSSAKLTLSFIMNGQRLVKIKQLIMKANGLLVQGHSAGNVFALQQAKIGRNEISGTLTIPATPGSPWVVEANGAVLDVRPQALAGQKHVGGSVNTSPQKELLWRTNLAFKKVYTAPPPASPLLDVHLAASGAGENLTRANFSAQGVQAVIGVLPDGRRSLSMKGKDAGALLNIFGVYSGISGGTLGLEATFGHGPMRGTLELHDVRLVHAPGFVKVLQAATLYGVAEALSGPGLTLNHTIIPFTLDQNILTLHEADSYSEALGFTASGTINIANDTCDLDTTIIPAYALNSFLGKIPLIGRLFTAEKGGGLFSMRARVQGKLDDPEVSVNPLSVFTPGLLRGIFGLGRLAPKH